MEENQLLVKPSFNEEITAQIKTVGEITSNINEVKKHSMQLKEYYSNIVFDENSLSVAKDERAKINKFKTAVSDYRKNIISEFKKPIYEFETLAKETEKILKETADMITEQTTKYDEQKKEEKRQEAEAYFEEYKSTLGIDFIKYADAKINVTLAVSLKILKEQIKEFVDSIKEDLDLINTQEFKDEIMVEYKQTLDVTKSITTVLNRKEMLRREKEIAERQAKEKELLQNNLGKFEKITEVEKSVLQPPILENIAKTIVNTEEEKLQLTFCVEGTRNQLKELKQFIIDKNIKIIK